LGLVTLTVIPGTAAPVVSVTDPSIDPVVDVCANTLPANSANDISSADKAMNLKTFFIFCFPFLNWTKMLPPPVKISLFIDSTERIPKRAA
jgi:hypothetical protein